ncbi:hypothetical protein T439DRAFT_323660 [Meredithblackwellia eburnea MCA 4105]
MAEPGEASTFPPSPTLRDQASINARARASVDFAVSGPPVPIRQDDYRSDDDFDDDGDSLSYAPSSAGSAPLKKGRHQQRPSTSALLPTPDDQHHELPPPTLAPTLFLRNERLRDYELDIDESNISVFSKVRRAIASLRAFVKLNEGFLLIALAQLLFATINTCVKLLQDLVSIPVWQLIAIRMSVTYLGCITYMRWAKTPHPFLGPPGVRILLCVRGVVGFGGLFGMYYSLKYLTLSDAVVLSFISPVLVGVLAAIFLKETYTKVEALTGVLSLFGVVLIAKPTFLFGNTGSAELSGPGGVPTTPEQRSVAVGVAMMGVFGSAGAYLCIRKIGKRANALHSISYFSIYSTVVSCLYPLFFHAPPVIIWDRYFFLLITPIGILGFAAQALLTMGLQREKAGRGTLAVYSLLLFAMVFERVVFGKFPDILSLFGSIIIISGAVYVVIKKKADPPSSHHVNVDTSGRAVGVRKTAVVSARETDERKAEEGRAYSSLADGESNEENSFALGDDDTFEEEEDQMPAALPSAGGTGER